MESKGIFPKFWGRNHESDGAPEHRAPAEPSPAATPAPADPLRGSVELMAYEDIYHAAGILSPRSGFGIHKVREMLNSERIRDLAPEIQRASVLMAIEAAGATADEILQDAQRRQHALDTYEAAQQKQVDEFAGRKTKENSQIRAEMDKVAAHYAERMQRNDDQVAQEKQALRDWQMAKQHESQRIADVMKLCSREPAPAVVSSPATAAAKAGAGAGSSSSTPFGPSLVPGGQA